MKRLYLVFLLCLAAPLEAQTTRYAGLQGVELRSDPAPEASVIGQIAAGSAVEIIEPDVGGYARVRSAAGTEGWALSASLLDAPATDESSDPLADIQPFTGELPPLPDVQALPLLPAQDQPSVSEPSTDASEQIMASVTEGEVSPSAVETNMLQSRLATLEKDVQSLRAANKTLKNSHDQKWFVIGAATVLMGMLIGLIVPKIRWRRKSWHSI